MTAAPLRLALADWAPNAAEPRDHPKVGLDAARSQVKRFGQDVRGMGPAGGCLRRLASSLDGVLACSPHCVDGGCICSRRALRRGRTGAASGRATRSEGGRQREGEWCWRDGSVTTQQGSQRRLRPPAGMRAERDSFAVRNSNSRRRRARANARTGSVPRSLR